MSLADDAIRYFNESRVMQIASLRDDYPRVNSVYYVPAPNYMAVYWMSEPRRRHSHDVMERPKIGGAIAFKTDEPVAGLQFTGRGSIVEDEAELRNAIDAYNEKYHNAAQGLFERIQAGTNKHQVYKVTIESLEVFDGTEPHVIELG